MTQACPKPLLQVGGKALIDHALDQVDDVAPKHIVVNLHYLGHQIRQHLAGRQDIKYSEELPDILETGGGLRHALPLLGSGPVYTFNSDAVWLGPNPLAIVRDAWDPDKMDALLLLVSKAQAIGHKGGGDFEVSSEGLLTRGPGPIYAGVQILKTDRLAGLPETKFSLNAVWDQMIEDDRLFGVSYPGKWVDVGRPEGIKLAEDLLADV
ncbi:MAG: nucleotidyltransferase family protein [Pseudomonadota bacterium]